MIKIAFVLIPMILFSACINLNSNQTNEKNNGVAHPAKYSVVEADIPLTYYGNIDGVELGYQIAPHNVAMKSLEAFYKFHDTGNESYRDRGLYLADWLLDNAKSRNDGNFVVWEYSYPWPSYDLKPGWTGSLNQATIIKALTFAHLYSGDKKYTEMIGKALNAFDVEVKDGGLKVLREDEGKIYVWYPEYAKENPPYVLNGFITVIIRLREYYLITTDKKAERLYQEGLVSLEHYLPDYDAGNKRSYYDALGNMANDHYHEMHVAQLNSLYEYTKNPIFKEYKEKWERN